MRSLTLVCRSAGSAGLTEHYFMQSHSWAFFCQPYWKAKSQPLPAISNRFQAIPGYSRLPQANPGNNFPSHPIKKLKIKQRRKKMWFLSQKKCWTLSEKKMTAKNERRKEKKYLDPPIRYFFFSSWQWWYYPHCSKGLVSPVCGVLFCRCLKKYDNMNK